jgi:hypothetical protein
MGIVESPRKELSMTSISRHHVPSSSALLMRILERPELVSAVQDLPAPVLGKLIDRIGLEDAGEIVALASTEQLERMFDDDLWKAGRPGDDESFRPERFALWINIMREGGEDFLIKRLMALPQDLLVLAVHRLVHVIDIDELGEHFDGPSEELDQVERALDSSDHEEWEEFRLVARDPMSWDDIWSALMALDRDHYDRLRAILEQCCAMTTEYISGNGGLWNVLTSEEMLESDVAAGREDRRAEEGFVSPADARSFLEIARRNSELEARDPITRAYFRNLQPTAASAPRAKPAAATGSGQSLAASSGDVAELMALLADAQVVSAADQQPLAALTSGAKKSSKAKAKSKSKSEPERTAPLFEEAMADLREAQPPRFFERVEELGYLINVLVAGGAHEGRRPRPVEALETVLRACEAGLKTLLPAKPKRERALAVLAETSADLLFRRGFSAIQP